LLVEFINQAIKTKDFMTLGESGYLRQMITPGYGRALGAAPALGLVLT
jgi:hypothetical protein